MACLLVAEVELVVRWVEGGGSLLETHQPLAALPAAALTAVGDEVRHGHPQGDALLTPRTEGPVHLGTAAAKPQIQESPQPLPIEGEAGIDHQGARQAPR